jgi:chromosome segregation ATPase
MVIFIKRGVETMKQLSTIQLQQQIIHYKSELHKYQQRCIALENDFPVKKVTSLKHELSRLQAVNEQLTKSISEWQTKFKEANETMQSKSAIIKKQQTEHHKLLSKFQLLKEQHRKGKSLNKSIQDQHEQSLMNLQVMWQDLKDFERKCIACQIDGEYLKEEKRQLTIERDTLKKWLIHTEVSMIEGSLEGDEKYRTQMQAMMHTLEEQLLQNHRLGEIKNLLDSSAVQIQVLNKQAKSYKEQINELEAALQNEKKINNEFASALRSLRIRIKEWKEHMQHERMEPSQHTDLSPMQKNRYHTTIEHLQFVNAKLIEEINQLRNKR